MKRNTTAMDPAPNCALKPTRLRRAAYLVR
ncbi:DUF1010 domain-containing protein [Pulveribacter suum]